MIETPFSSAVRPGAETRRRYDAALAWLWSLVNDPEGRRFFKPKSHAAHLAQMADQMARMADFLEFAGHPEHTFPAVHVAGTSGKGSVTAMLGHLLVGQGQRVAWHTSPYLQLPLEKLSCGGRWIRPTELAAVIERLRRDHEAWTAASPGSRLRYGEAWVALTFTWLAGLRPDWAVVETGMGGRFDPTNVLPSRLAVITNVAWDHAQALGPGLADIAWHKAGIIKPGRPVVSGVTEPDLRAVVEAEAREKAAPLYQMERDFSYQTLDEGTIAVRGPYRRFEAVPVGPRGRFQHVNAALAVAALDVLTADHPLDEGQVSLAGLTCPGRFEQVQERPAVILDGAHNPHKMAAFVESLCALYPDRRKIGVVGGIANKEVEATLAPLLPVLDRLVVTAPQVPGKPAVPPAEIARWAGRSLPALQVTTEETAAGANAAALDAARPDDLVVITGSLYLVGDAREYWYPKEELWLSSEHTHP